MDEKTPVSQEEQGSPEGLDTLEKRIEWLKGRKLILEVDLKGLQERIDALQERAKNLEKRCARLDKMREKLGPYGEGLVEQMQRDIDEMT